MKQRLTGLGLVLLVLACTPETSYGQGCGPLPEGWITPRQGRGVLSAVNVVSVKAGGAMEWNGVAVTEPVLRSYLEQAGKLDPRPVTQLKFDPAVDCEGVRRLRQVVVESLDCSFGHCAEGSGKWWFTGDVVGPGISRGPFEWDAPTTAGDRPR